MHLNRNVLRFRLEYRAEELCLVSCIREYEGALALSTSFSNIISVTKARSESFPETNRTCTSYPRPEVSVIMAHLRPTPTRNFAAYSTSPTVADSPTRIISELGTSL